MLEIIALFFIEKEGLHVNILYCSVPKSIVDDDVFSFFNYAVSSLLSAVYFCFLIFF